MFLKEELPTWVSALVKETCGFEDWQLDVRSCWSSENHEHRQLIRKALLARVQNHPLVENKADLSVILDLNEVPRLAFGKISISHCPKLGGFAFSLDRECSLGLDLEEVARLRKPVVERISTTDELQSVPRWEMLWSAKESVWKSLSIPNAPISDIQIHSWLSMDSEISAWRFEAEHTRSGQKCELSGRGCILRYDGCWISVFKSKPSMKS